MEFICPFTLSTGPLSVFVTVIHDERGISATGWKNALVSVSLGGPGRRGLPVGRSLRDGFGLV